jgi:cell pole-organizing protein PopZ
MGDIQQDPSMEDILASIKRVIAEDGRVAGAARGARRSARAEAEEPVEPDDVLELDDPVGGEGEGLLSPVAAAASRQQLAALSALRDRGEAALAPVGDGPLEAVVRDMLRPMLKDWLDQHLPELVEELVTREISRITGRNL